MPNPILPILVLPLALFAGCATHDAEHAQAPKSYSIDQFLESSAIGGGYFNGDGSRLLFHSNEDGIFNLYSVDTSTRDIVKLTDSADNTFALAYFPNDDRVLFRRDNGGDEIFKLYVLDEQGRSRQLTAPGPAREMFFGFNREGSAFYTGNNSRDRRYFDVYRWSIDTLEPRMVYENVDGLGFAAVSGDERWLALRKTVTRFESRMYLYDTASGERPQPILDAYPEDVNFFPLAFTPDGSRLLYSTDEGSEFLYVKSFDLSTHEQTVEYPGNWDVVDANFSDSGRYRVLTENANGSNVFHILDVATGKPVELTLPADLDVGSLAFDRSGRHARIFAGSPRSPENLYLYDMATGRLDELISTRNPEIDPADLVSPTRVTFAARDSLVLNAYLYRPKGAADDARVPALIWVHGGPGGQSRADYSGRKQFLVNRGYCILDVNYRGSFGFGRAFSMADDRKHGREPLWDVIDAKRWLVANHPWPTPGASESSAARTADTRSWPRSPSSPTNSPSASTCSA